MNIRDMIARAEGFLIKKMMSDTYFNQKLCDVHDFMIKDAIYGPVSISKMIEKEITE